jgi:hypothetical protein
MVLAEDLKSEIRNPKSEIPVKGIRKIIADRMRQSLQSTAQLTMTMSFDVAALQRYRAAAKARGERVTINDLIVYATAQTLKKHPLLNAHFLGDRIAQSAAIHIGIAVDTSRGLMVPVLKNVESLSVVQVAAQVRPLAEACQAGSINPDLLSGGTFTITNLGSLGVETFTPVLNAPEVAILGVGGMQLKPVKRDGGFAFVEAITLSLTIDHQAVDGAPGGAFPQRFVRDAGTDGYPNERLGPRFPASGHVPTPETRHLKPTMHDLIIIGGGPGGYVAAERAAARGLKVLLAEHRQLGGVCLNEGCIPSKTLLNSAKIYQYATHGGAYGVKAGSVSFDFTAVQARKGQVMDTLRKGVAGLMKKFKVEVVPAGPRSRIGARC